MLQKFTSVLLSLFATVLAVPQAFATTPGEIWEHHIEAWGTQDLDTILEDYTDTSLLVINGQEFLGKNEIRIVFARLFEIFDGGENTISPVLIRDSLVYITWMYQPLNSERPFFGTDTFLIEEGKIRIQTIGSALYRTYPIQPEIPAVGVYTGRDDAGNLCQLRLKSTQQLGRRAVVDLSFIDREFADINYTLKYIRATDSDDYYASTAAWTSAFYLRNLGEREAPYFATYTVHGDYRNRCFFDR